MKQRLNSGLSQHLSKRLRAFDKGGSLKDGVLYRDERYFLNLEASLATTKTTNSPEKPVISMTAPLEEKGDAGPLVPCKVTTQ